MLQIISGMTHINTAVMLYFLSMLELCSVILNKNVTPFLDDFAGQ